MHINNNILCKYMHKTGIIQGARRPIKGGNLIMKKKLVAAAMAAVMAVSLTACGGSQPAETTAAATEAATEAASEEATEAASEEEKAEETEAAAAEFTTITPGKLMVGTSPDFAPYEFYHIGEDGTPQLAGFDVALAQRIADDLGLELQMVPMDFDGILMELQNGNIDLGISGFSPSPERAEVFDFSDLYYTGGQSFCIRQADKEKYTKFEDFKDLPVGAQNGSIQYGLAEKNTPDANIIGLAKVTDIVSELVSGKLEGAFIETAVAEQYARPLLRSSMQRTIRSSAWHGMWSMTPKVPLSQFRRATPHSLRLSTALSRPLLRTAAWTSTLLRQATWHPMRPTPMRASWTQRVMCSSNSLRKVR